mgnify:CR=1 FL=1
MTTEEKLKKCFLNAINEYGIEKFKKLSLFLSNDKVK